MSIEAVAADVFEHARRPSSQAAVRALLGALRAAGDVGLQHDAVRIIAGRSMLAAGLLYDAGLLEIEGSTFRLAPQAAGRLAAESLAVSRAEEHEA